MSGDNVSIDLFIEELKKLLQAVQDRALEGVREAPTLESVDYETWITWRERFEAVVAMNKWGPKRARQEIAVVVGGKARLYILHMNLVPEDPVPPVEQLLDEIHDRLFSPAYALVFDMYLTRAKQKPGESLLDWYGRIWCWYQRANPGFTSAEVENSRELIQVFIRGLSCNYTRTRIVRVPLKTLSGALDSACSIQAHRELEALTKRSRHE